MGIEKPNEIIEAYKIFKGGLEEEDRAFLSRSNNLLTFNSLLALALVGILQKGFDPQWRSILIFSIPIVAIIINILWLWLGCRTMLSFMYYFNQIRNIEESSDPKCIYFDYAKSRNEFWIKNKKGITSIVSNLWGSNKLFCYWIPRITYSIWTLLLVFVISKYVSCIVTALIALGFFVLLIMFFWIGIESLKRHKIPGE